MKGTAMNNLKKYIVALSDEETYNEIANKSGLVKHGIILASSWYPARDYMLLQEKAAERLNLSMRQISLDSAKYVLEIDLNGVYKFFMRLAGSEGIFGKLPKLSTTYLNFVNYHVEKNQKGLLEASFEIPSSLCDWFIDNTEGSLLGILWVCKYKMQSFEVLSRTVSRDNPAEPMESVSYRVRYS